MKIEIELPGGRDLELIQEFVTNTAEDGNSHGKLTVEKLALMLMQDVAMAIRRPGSWEGANMFRVLTAHGYKP